MRPTPYIGITGISLPTEPALILQDTELKSGAKVMLGTCVSHKTLQGGTATKHPARYPDVHTLESLMSADPRVMNLLHFNTQEPEQLLADLNQLQMLAGPLCHGFQLNMSWPKMTTLERYKAARDKEHGIIVLQCGKKALKEMSYNPKVLAAQVSTYLHVIDYVLIDISGGEGQDFDIEQALDYFAALEQFETLGFGIAGGLSADTVLRLRRIVERFDSFSIDAESRLRRPEDDGLMIGRTARYLTNADRIFAERNLLRPH